MLCLFYSPVIKKSVPCRIKPNIIITRDIQFSRICYANVEFNDTDLDNYSVSRLQVARACSEYIDLNELYPIEVQADEDYYNAFVTTGAVTIDGELNRYEKLYNALMDVPEITTFLLYSLCNFIVTDLQFRYLTHEEKLSMRSLSDVIYSELPQETLDLLLSNTYPHFLRMIRNLFNKAIPDEIFDTHILQNINHITEYEYVFPLELSVINIRNNLEFLFVNYPELF